RGRVRVRHILLAVPPAAFQVQRDSVLQRAYDLHYRILGGADFARLAREFSDDPYSAPKGGDLGWIEAGQMPESFEQVAFSLEPGRVSRPVETPSGFHLLKVEDRETLGVFGRDVFSRPTSQFQEVTSGPVDPGYRLGP
ncbi:MAG: hypothetical protein GWN82_12675, partial [Gemmatimonadetes bacterium]|nr:hypothetical protein [Gemmatimonadota bacterium]